jgi:hypothetical protein
MVVKLAGRLDGNMVALLDNIWAVYWVMTMDFSKVVELVVEMVYEMAALMVGALEKWMAEEKVFLLVVLKEFCSVGLLGIERVDLSGNAKADKSVAHLAAISVGG